jgi:hypothetical protein
MAISKLDQHGDIVETNIIRDVYPDLNQKNWMPLIKDDLLFFIYSIDPVIPLNYSLYSHKSELLEKTESNEYDISNHRGGSHVIFLEEYDCYICVTHEVYWKPHRIYLHRFVLLDTDLKLKQVSDPFYFREKNIEFCCGMARVKNPLNFSDKLYLSFGVRDHEAWILKVSVPSVLRFIGK